MDNDEIEFVLEIEQHLAACMKKVRMYKQTKQINKTKRTQLEIVEEILKNAAKPLHINDVLSIAAERYNLNLNRETVVSALTKHVKTNHIFCKTGKNIFGLINFGNDNHGNMNLVK